MKTDPTKKSPSGELLSGLIAFDQDGRTLWPLADLEAALKENLELPLTTLARHLDPYGASVAIDESSLNGTLGELLLEAPDPCIEMLRAVKDFSKREVGRQHASLPPDIALLLYYCSIVTARLRLNERISRLSDDDLRRGLNWAARQIWLDTATRNHFLEGLSYLRAPRARWRP